MIRSCNQRAFQLTPGIDMTLASPGGGTPHHDGSNAFVPSGMFHYMLRIQPRCGRQVAIDADFFQRSQACFDLGPVGTRRIGQHFQLGFHAPTQRSTHFQQALHRRNRTQGDDDAAFHLSGEAEPESQEAVTEG